MSFSDRCHASEVAEGMAMKENRRLTSNLFVIVNIPLSRLLEAYMGDPDSPEFQIVVRPSDLYQFKADIIDELMERIRPLWVQPEQDVMLTRKEVAAMLNVCETTVHNHVVAGRLKKIMVGKAVRYSKLAVQEFIDSQKQ